MDTLKIYHANGTLLKDENGTEITTKSLTYTGSWMGECFVSVTFKNPAPINFSIGDYLTYRGEVFEINYDPGKIKSYSRNSTGEAFTYDSVKFNSKQYELVRAEFLDIVLHDNETHYTSLTKFPFYVQSVDDLLDRIQANLDEQYGAAVWKLYSRNEDRSVQRRCLSEEWVNVYGEGIADNVIKSTSITVDGKTCWDALALVNSQFGINFIVRGRNVYVGTAGVPTSIIFEYGKGNGLYEIEQNADSEQSITTRLRAYGSTKNMPSRYYANMDGSTLPNNMAVNNLMLPGFPNQSLQEWWNAQTTETKNRIYSGSKAHIFSDNKYRPFVDSTNINEIGVRPNSIYFDTENLEEGIIEIYPTIEEMEVGGVRIDVVESADIIGDNGVFNDGETIPNFHIYLKSAIDFDINDLIKKSTETPYISMKDGMCGAREFQINSAKKLTDGIWELTCQRQADESLNLYFPYNDYQINGGDHFVLIGIPLPDSYVTAASIKLLKYALEFLDKNDYTRYVYSPKIDEIFMARQHDAAMADTTGTIRSIHDTIKEGDFMQFTDNDLGIEGSVTIDQLTIKEEDGKIPTYEVTLREDKSVGTIQKIQNKISSLESGNGGLLSAGGATSQQIQKLIESYGGKRFLSKLSSDTAQGVITFLQGLTSQEVATFLKGAKFGEKYGITNIGEATLTQIVADAIGTPGFVSSLIAGIGWRIDEDGVLECNGIKVRSYMEVMELIVNRLSAIEGDQLLTEADTIESVDDLGNSCYGLHLCSKWDGYFTAQANNNVLKGIINTLSAGSGTYYTAWFRVNSVNTANNYIEVTQYPDAETPAGKNYPPCAMMKIARWGNQTDTTRQSCLYLSSTEGRIVKLTGVTKPIIDKTNYGAVFGTPPEFLKALDLPLRDGRDYMYIPGIITTDVIRIDYQGAPIAEYVDRGTWSATESYYHNDKNPNTGVYEISGVWYNGCKYRCQKTGTNTAPAWNNTDWAMIEGNPDFTVDFAESENIYDPDNFNATLTIVAKLYNIDITGDILDADVAWTRYSQDADGVERTASDNAWALKRANSGKSITLTIADCDINGYMPKKLRFTATVTLRDGAGNAASVQSVSYEY